MAAPRVLSTLRAAMDDLTRDQTFPVNQEFKLTMIMQPHDNVSCMTQVVQVSAYHEPLKDLDFHQIDILGSWRCFVPYHDSLLKDVEGNQSGNCRQTSEKSTGI